MFALLNLTSTETLLTITALLYVATISTLTPLTDYVRQTALPCSNTTFAVFADAQKDTSQTVILTVLFRAPATTVHTVTIPQRNVFLPVLPGHTQTQIVAIVSLSVPKVLGETTLSV